MLKHLKIHLRHVSFLQTSVHFSRNGDVGLHNCGGVVTPVNRRSYDLPPSPAACFLPCPLSAAGSLPHVTFDRHGSSLFHLEYHPAPYSRPFLCCKTRPLSSRPLTFWYFSACISVVPLSFLVPSNGSESWRLDEIPGRSFGGSVSRWCRVSYRTALSGAQGLVVAPRAVLRLFSRLGW